MTTMSGTVCLWCALVAILPWITGTQLDMNAEEGERLSVRLPSPIRRDMQSLTEERRAEEERMEERMGEETDECAPLCSELQSRDYDSTPPQPSSEEAVRPGRWLRSVVHRGCKLSTCYIHDVGHWISVLGQASPAPKDKIDPKGYGRRRRRSPRVRRVRRAGAGLGPSDPQSTTARKRT